MREGKLRLFGAMKRTEVDPIEQAERDRYYGGRSRLSFHVESVFIALIVLAFLAIIAATFVLAEPIAAGSIRVIDGDTIALKGSRQHVRLVGFNAPETRNAECPAERQLGARAKQRLIALVESARSELQYVRCSCEPGTEDTRWCNHGRRCGTLLIDGKDAGSILISEGLAVPFKCEATRCPPTPRPWCQ